MWKWRLSEELGSVKRWRWLRNWRGRSERNTTFCLEKAAHHHVPRKLKRKRNTGNHCSRVCLQRTIAQMQTITFAPDATCAGDINHRHWVQHVHVLLSWSYFTKKTEKIGIICFSSPFIWIFFTGRVLSWFRWKPPGICCCCCCYCCNCCYCCCHLLH